MLDELVRQCFYPYTVDVQQKGLTAVISHTRPQTIFSPFQKLRFGGRQSNASMTITASGAVTGTTISMSISQSIRVALSSLLDSSINKTETEK